MANDRPPVLPKPGQGVVRTSSVTSSNNGDRPAPTPRPGGGVTTTRDGGGGTSTNSLAEH